LCFANDYILIDTQGAKGNLQDAAVLAAESHVDRSISGAAEFIKTNIVGTYTRHHNY
jgi:dTDP-D-glucose 4,6-dehydratase